MNNWTLKTKLAVLWIFLAVSMSAYFMLYLMMPGLIEGVIVGVIDETQISEELLLVYAIFWLVPLTMAFLSLILKDSINRWVNLIMGAIWLILGTMISVTNGYISIAHLLIDIALNVVCVIIIWHAWKWPKQT